jgi:hypothetical protein
MSRGTWRKTSRQEKIKKYYPIAMLNKQKWAGLRQSSQLRPRYTMS